MTKIQTFVASLMLIVVLSMSALAGDMNTPPCAPGDINTPPCSSAQLVTDEPTNLEQTPTSPAVEPVVISMIAEAAVAAVLSVW